MTDDLLRRVLSVQAESGKTERMTNFIAEELRRIDPGIRIRRKKGNLYATKGDADIYPCVVAHTDTVHTIIPEKDYHVYSDGSIYFAFDSGRKRMTGIGGDDKVGIYVALTMVERLPNVKVAFFRDEEIGCVGSASANIQFFSDCAFVLQCDRRGYGDFVNDAGSTELHGDEFADAVQPILDTYGFKPSYGSMTDVMELKDRGVKVACANMSCGYYRPHTDEEYVVIEEVRLVTNMVQDICKLMGDRQWKHVKPRGVRRRVTRWRSSYWERDYESHGYYSGNRGQGQWNSNQHCMEYLCEECWEYTETTFLRNEYGSYLCDDCTNGYRLLEHEEYVRDGQLLMLNGGTEEDPKFVTVEEYNRQIVLDADISRIRNSGPNDDDFLWALDQENDLWPDELKREVIQTYYEMCEEHGGQRIELVA